METYEGLDLADPEFGTTGLVDVLLGADHYGEILQSFTAGGGAHEVRPMHRRRALDGSWLDHFEPLHSIRLPE